MDKAICEMTNEEIKDEIELLADDLKYGKVEEYNIPYVNDRITALELMLRERFFSGN